MAFAGAVIEAEFYASFQALLAALARAKGTR